MELAEKEIKHENISISDMVLELERNKNNILDDFSKAYLAETGLLPSEVELSCRQMPVDNGIIEHIYSFRRKS